MPTAAPAFRLRVWTRFFAPVERVWELKTDLARVREEFRPWMEFRPQDPEALCRAVRSGQTGRFPARLWPLGISWTTELVEARPTERFVDRSQNLLYAAFEHRHVFEPADDGCRYVDDVTFTPAAPLPAGLVARMTAAMFGHRHRQSARHLPHDARATAIVVLRQVLEDEGPAELG